MPKDDPHASRNTNQSSQKLYNAAHDLRDMGLREIPCNFSTNCYGCSRNNPRGLQLRFCLSDQGCLTRCSIPGYLCGFDGLVHGGIIATLLDEVAAWTNFAYLLRIGVTLEASVRYLKPVPTETEILLEGKVVRHDEKSSVIASTIRSAEGTLLTESQSKWLLPDYSTLARVTGIDEQTLEKTVRQMMESIRQLHNDAKETRR